MNQADTDAIASLSSDIVELTSTVKRAGSSVWMKVLTTGLFAVIGWGLTITLQMNTIQDTTPTTEEVREIIQEALEQHRREHE